VAKRISDLPGAEIYIKAYDRFRACLCRDVSQMLRQYKDSTFWKSYPGPNKG